MLHLPHPSGSPLLLCKENQGTPGEQVLCPGGVTAPPIPVHKCPSPAPRCSCCPAGLAVVPSPLSVLLCTRCSARPVHDRPGHHPVPSAPCSTSRSVAHTWGPRELLVTAEACEHGRPHCLCPRVGPVERRCQRLCPHVRRKLPPAHSPRHKPQCL